jgi:hypothetical protein
MGHCPDLSAAGMNFAMLLKWAAAFLRLTFYLLFGFQRALLVLLSVSLRTHHILLKAFPVL